jgi:hypothetical protein
MTPKGRDHSASRNPWVSAARFRRLSHDRRRHAGPRLRRRQCERPIPRSKASRWRVTINLRQHPRQEFRAGRQGACASPVRWEGVKA